jgi:radical SAM superfamily enzyme YgiQ (UPF0313 family)
VSQRSVDALFFSYFEDVDRWWNDYAPSRSGPTGAPAVRSARNAPEGRSFLARIARESAGLAADDGSGAPLGVLDLSRFLSLAAHGDTREYRRYDAFSINQLAGKYYQSLARRNGFELVHFDVVTRVEVERLGEVFAPRWVMLSSTFATETANLLDAIQHLKRAFPGAPIVVGGLFLVEIEKALTKEQFPRLLASLGADVYVVSPLGEASFLELLRAPGRELEGLALPSAWVREGRKFVKRPTEDPGVPIDEHYVRWDALDPNGLYAIAHTRTARSCAFECSFCSYPANQGALTLEQPQTLEAELRTLQRVGRVRTLVFTDDTFNVPTGRFKELCRVLARFDFRWYAYFRCQFADPETIALMQDAGCQGVFLGYESLDDNVLRNMRKAVNRKAYERGTELVKAAGFATHANFIVGFPGDRAQNVQLALDFVDRHGIDFHYFSPWFCSPATPVAQEKERFGIEGDFLRWKHDTMSSDEAIDLCEGALGAARESVWMGDQAARSFWSQILLYSNGLSRDEVKAAARAYNRFVGRDVTRAELLADEGVRALGTALTRCAFPEPPGMEYFRGAEEAAPLLARA